MTEFKLNLKTITEQIKFTRSKINIIKNNFKDFKKEISLNEIKELGKANNSLKESVEGSFEVFDVILNDVQSECNTF